jgi:gamma-glutamyltranspeptidase/glutathione hydrolase
VAQLAARAILGGVDLEDAQVAPRWTVFDFGPGASSTPSFEPGIDEVVLTELRSRAHDLTVVDGPQPGWGPMSLIELDGSVRRAAADPRVDTTAALVF